MFQTQAYQRLCLVPKWIVLLVVAAMLQACELQSVKKEGQATQPSTSQLSQLEETVALQQRQIMELEIRLIAKQSEIDKLSSIQEETINEVVRLKAKLRSRHSKADIVANLAEAKLLLKSLQAETGQHLQAELLKRAGQYISMSETALEKGNYDGASYLIGQARVSLATSDSDPEEQLENNAKITVFSIPVPMQVKQLSNVRAGPGMAQKVMYRLKSGTSVLATGYRGLWVQVNGENGIRGWIHYSLLETIP